MHRGVPRRGYINAASQFYACRVVYVVFAEVLDGMRGEEMGGGIFALRRPRPYSRHCGEGVAMHAASTIFTPHRHQWEGVEADHDAARRVATSSGKRGNRI